MKFNLITHQKELLQQAQDSSFLRKDLYKMIRKILLILAIVFVIIIIMSLWVRNGRNSIISTKQIEHKILQENTFYDEKTGLYYIKNEDTRRNYFS